MRLETLKKAKRLVVKIGSGVLTHHSEIIDLKIVESIASDLSVIANMGKEVILVTSGAVAAGRRKLGLKGKPKSIPEKQAAAAAGQSTLIRFYEDAFDKRGKRVGQILLTGDALSNRERYLNARNTIFALLHHGVIPIINENDSVAVDEIKFGDNDNLSAMVTGLADADLLIILTDTDGLYDKDPRKFSDARLIETVRDFESQTRGASIGISDTGTGGMLTKTEAARKSATFGVPSLIANGEKKGVLLDIFNGGGSGTFFIPREERIKGKKKWIAYNINVSGTLLIDSGAKKALVAGKSLLPSGVKSVKGDFSFGDLVSISEEGGGEFARGLVQFDSDDLEKMKGLKSSEIVAILGKKDYDEVIHRDDMVIL
ncbi:MAG: glutamate 5-kinase [Deltaproteobacteria bacterium]|nr:glutamate 5-kinase [Deltaproteobacteria bacterium]